MKRLVKRLAWIAGATILVVFTFVAFASFSVYLVTSFRKDPWGMVVGMILAAMPSLGVCLMYWADQ
jgi:RsiW-degrading membrane proteinase PrsW (M82 family)